MNYDYDRSLAIARAITVIPKQCYNNAVRALRNREFRKHTVNLSNAKYVEGNTSDATGLIAPHGWLELEDGTVIDPTRAQYYNDSKEFTYYPLVRYSKADLKGVKYVQLPLAEKELSRQQLRLYGIE